MIKPSKETKDRWDSIITDYLSRWPNLPSRTLALMIYNQNNELFLTPEQVRGFIRWRRGRNGKRSRAITKSNRYARFKSV